MRKKRTTTMEGSERSHPHRSGSSAGGASDFFICFTARPSSSAATSTASASMRVPSSKALMSPGRGRDPSSAPALSASLSRRLRNSGSVKGGQSPMFPSGVPLAGRKKGCAYEATEPSSPKVTCIGQVRVKAKKKVKSKAKKAMARSRSQRGRREAERECCTGKNQSWVHQVPLSICETLRGIGSEFSCFLPCGGRSLCGGGGGGGSSRTGEEKGRDERRIGRSASSSSCGQVLARWVVAVQEGEEEVKGTEKVEVGFLLREREEKMAEVEIEELRSRGGEKGVGGEEEAARVSVCIPPRNALLLMRCRSDPVRMAALANRFWGSPVNKQQSEEERIKEEENELEDVVQKQARTANTEEEEEPEDRLTEKEESDAVENSVTAVELVEEENDCEKTAEVETTASLMEVNLQLLDEEINSARENLSCESPPMLKIHSSREEQEKNEVVRNRSDHLPEKEEEKAEDKIRGKEERRYGNICASRSKERGKRRYKEKVSRRHSFSSEIDSRRHSFSSESEARRASFSIDRGTRWSFSLGKSDLESKDVKTLPFSAAEVCPEEEGAKSRGDKVPEKPANGAVKHEPEVENEKKGVAGEWTELPDCLLMMMYEPKLSMEVSKETWVSGNDFLRWRPNNTRNRIPPKPDIAAEASGDNEAAPPTESASILSSAAEDAVPVAVTAPPAEPPRATAVQHKVSARPAAVAPYEPLVLTRCKSEPVRSSARLTADACFWKDRHRPIGAAGLGF
ncbi:hypothetical protein KSP39_PZI024184 [Platanthera zijinensis]|uniref:Chloroplast protein HCF243 n=1 Tax=Platanthera zijinensis TaxID=2320716 RepID=A0AAP0AT31_9ASPA